MSINFAQAFSQMWWEKRKHITEASMTPFGNVPNCMMPFDKKSFAQLSSMLKNSHCHSEDAIYEIISNKYYQRDEWLGYIMFKPLNDGALHTVILIGEYVYDFLNDVNGKPLTTYLNDIHGADIVEYEINSTKSYLLSSIK